MATTRQGGPRPTITREVLNRYVDAGLTLAQMAERWQEETGTTRAVSSFAVAMSRAGIKSSNPVPRYKDELPWHVVTEHAMHYDARMLRYLGRRKAGLPVSDEWDKKLTAWLKRHDEEGTVVYYDARSKNGFYAVPREESDGDGYVRATTAD